MKDEEEVEEVEEGILGESIHGLSLPYVTKCFHPFFRLIIVI